MPGSFACLVDCGLGYFFLAAFLVAFFAGAFFAAFFAGAFFAAAFFAAFFTAKGVPLLFDFLLPALFLPAADFFATLLPPAPFVLFFAADFFTAFLAEAFFAGAFFAAFLAGAFFAGPSWPEPSWLELSSLEPSSPLPSWPEPSSRGPSLRPPSLPELSSRESLRAGPGAEELQPQPLACLLLCALLRRHRCRHRQRRGKSKPLPLRLPLHQNRLPILLGIRPFQVRNHRRCARIVCDLPASKLPSGLGSRLSFSKKECCIDSRVPRREL